MLRIVLNIFKYMHIRAMGPLRCSTHLPACLLASPPLYPPIHLSVPQTSDNYSSGSHSCAGRGTPKIWCHLQSTMKWSFTKANILKTFISALKHELSNSTARYEHEEAGCRGLRKNITEENLNCFLGI